MTNFDSDGSMCEISHMQKLLQPIEIFPLSGERIDDPDHYTAHCLVYKVQRRCGTSEYFVHGLVLTEFAEGMDSSYVVLGENKRSPLQLGDKSTIPGFTEFSASAHQYHCSGYIH